MTIIGSREKRMVTGTPVVSRDGTVALFQVIWKGENQQIPRIRPGTSQNLLGRCLA